MNLPSKHRTCIKFTILLLYIFSAAFSKCALAFAENVYKCCPNGSEMTIRLDQNANRIFDCIESVRNSTNILMAINLGTNIRMPNCPNMKLAKLEAGSELLSFGGCIDILNGDLHHLFCPERSKISVQHVHKCCPPNFALDISGRECVPISEDSQYLKDIFHKTVSILTYRVPKCLDDDVFVEYHVNSNQLILEYGGLEVRLSSGDDEYLPPGSFCVDETNNLDETFDSNFKDITRLIVKGCQPRIVCRRIPCIRKCCKSHQILERFNGTSICVDFSKNFRPTFHDVKLPLIVNDTEEVAKPEYGFLEKQTCKRYALTDDPAEIHFTSHSDGSLYMFNITNPIDNNEYCMEYFNGETVELMTFVCFKNPQKQFKYYAAGLTVSCVFLAITLIVYICLPKFLNLHGKTVVCHVISLLAAYISLAIVQFTLEKLKYCFFVALLIYFFFLAAFCWQSIMCFDIWWTFGSIRVSRGMRKTKEMRRFMFYSLYAWGIPSLLTLLVSLIDIYKVLPTDWSPQFGNNTCWFGNNNWRAHFIFFLLPIGLHIGTNLVLFILTAIHCNKVKNEIHRMQSSNDNETQKIKKRFIANKTKYIMNIKLFVVMGASWMLEIFAALLPQWNTIWYFSDAFNVFQGVLVFIIFVFKPKVWLSMQHKLGLKTKSVRGTTLATATSFMTGSKENLNSTRSKMGKTSSYTTLASSSVNLNNMRKPTCI